MKSLADLGILFFERGWLSSNNVLCVGRSHNTLVDTGYVDHARQTVALISSNLTGPLTAIVNTHLHSDHCGGNAAVQREHKGVETWVPVPSFDSVRNWDGDALTYEITGQACPPFQATHAYGSGDVLRLGDDDWEVCPARGHDPDAMLLYQREHEILISGDALWGNGLGVVFPELDGANAFEDALATLDLIRSLNPKTVIPGHGPVFTDVSDAANRAERRIKQWQSAPDTHYLYGLKVLLKFKLLSAQKMALTDLVSWAERTPYLRRLQGKAVELLEISNSQHETKSEMSLVVESLLTLLINANAARLSDGTVYNVG